MLNFNNFSHSHSVRWQSLPGPLAIQLQITWSDRDAGTPGWMALLATASPRTSLFFGRRKLSILSLLSVGCSNFSISLSCTLSLSLNFTSKVAKLDIVEIVPTTTLSTSIVHGCQRVKHWLSFWKIQRNFNRGHPLREWEIFFPFLFSCGTVFV